MGYLIHPFPVPLVLPDFFRCVVLVFLSGLLPLVAPNSRIPILADQDRSLGERIQAYGRICGQFQFLRINRTVKSSEQTCGLGPETWGRRPATRSSKKPIKKQVADGYSEIAIGADYLLLHDSFHPPPIIITVEVTPILPGLLGEAKQEIVLR